MRRLAVLALFLLFATVTTVSPVQAQDPVQVLDVDSYERTVAPGERTSFNWTVRNVDVVSYDIAVDAESMTGWQLTLTPTLIQNISPNRAAPIRVDVVSPDTVAAETVLNVKVVFTVFQDGAVVFVASRTATVTIPSIFAEKRVLGAFPNPLPSPLDNEWGVFLLDIALWLAISVLVLLILIPLVKKLGAMTKTRVADIVLRIVRTPLVLFLFLYGAIQSLGALDRHLDPSIQQILLTVYQIALPILLLYLGYRLFKDVFIYLAKTVSKRTASHLDDILVPLVEKVGLAVLGFVGLGLLIGFLNLDLTLFVAGGVVTSMVIAFAAQDTLSNFFSGIFLLTDRPFKEGDIVILSDGDWAEVRKIGMRTTRLFRFADASLVTLPNNRLVNDKIANFSNPQDKGRIMKTFGVAYGSDVAQVKRILLEVIHGNPHIITEEPLKPIIRFDAMGESSLDFFILVWIDERANRFSVRDYLNTEIYNRFNKAGIEIPFPQRTIHLRHEGADVGEAKIRKSNASPMSLRSANGRRTPTTRPARTESRIPR